MVTVALDTSILMAPVEADLRVFDELERLLGGFEPVVPTAVTRELAALAAAEGGLAARAAAVGRDLADRAEPVETAADDADDALVELAAAGAVDVVATADRALADRVLDAGTAVAVPRGRSTLQLTQP